MFDCLFRFSDLHCKPCVSLRELSTDQVGNRPLQCRSARPVGLLWGRGDENVDQYHSSLEFLMEISMIMLMLYACLIVYYTVRHNYHPTITPLRM